MNPSDDMHPDWRDALDGHESPLDVEGFWADLEPRLPKKRRRRGLLWWWTGGLVTVGVLAGLWMSRPGMQKATVLGEDGVTLAVTPDGKGQHVPGAPQQDEVAGLSGKRKQVEGIVSDRILPKPALTGKRVKSARPTGSADSEGAATPNQGKAMPTAPVDAAASILREVGSVPGTDIQASREAVNEEWTPAAAITSSRETSGNEASVQAVEEQATPKTEEVIEEQAPPSAVSPEAGKRRKRPELALDILGGPGISFRHLVAGDDATEVYLAQREATERPLESWSAGADLRWTAPNGWFVAGGFRWLRINERFDWRQEEQRSEYGLAEGLLLTANGTLVPWQDSAWITWQETRSVTHYNKVESVMVPLGVGYRFSRGPLSVEGALGGSWNIRQWASGRSLDRTGLPADWNGKDELLWKTSHGLGLFARCRLAWSTPKGPSFFLLPEVHGSAANRMDASAGYRVRYTQAFLQAGVSIRLK